MRNFLLLILLLPFASYGQYEKEIDSIRKNIKSRKTVDEKRADYQDLISFTVGNGLDSEAKKAIYDLRKLNVNGSCVECEALALYGEANLYSVSGDFQKAIPIFKSAAKTYEKIGKTYMYLSTTAKVAESLMLVKQTPEAEKLLIETISNHKNDEEQYGMPGIYYLLGFINYERKHYKTALDNYIKAEKSIEANDSNGPMFRILLFKEIADIYREQNNYLKAKETINKAYEICKIEKLDVMNLEVISTIGKIENHFNHFEKAIPFLEECRTKAIELKRPNNENISSIALAESYLRLNKFDKSIQLLKKCETYFEENEDHAFKPKLAILLAENYLETNNIELYNLYLKKTEDLLGANKITIEYLDFLDLKIKAALKNNQTIQVRNFLKEKDSITNLINIENSKASFEEFETRFRIQQKEQQIKLLSTQNELAQKQNYIYLGLLGLLALIGGSLFYGYRNKIKTAQKLKELNELKSRFFANISHEFRTPLTLIKSPVQSLLSEIPDSNQKNKLQLIDSNSTRMLELVDQLLELSKIDSGNLKLILKEGNISSLLHSIVEPFQFQAKEKGTNFNSNIQKTEENSAFDKDVIEKIVTNLISNAFKYSPQNESISFRSSVENSNLKLIVSNTGSDVKKEDLPKLFERFYQKNELKQGVGIGLALVKELVDLYHGTISTTIENEELSFIVTLPLAVANENAVVIPAKVENITIENAIPNDAEIPVLLIVDDNHEIRAVLRDIFKNDYQIIEAQNGEEALQLAQKEIPDCIISDVMMPKMDGFEFTKQIKNNELTSFIPIVLLTAKTSNEAHLEGLKSTADAFLTKPFNNDIVKATVNQLITERKKLHLRYSQELVLKPVDIVISSVEEKFIVKLQDILEKELSNSEFSTEDFAASTGMSRMQLHRKLKSLLGVSATEFLRNERLKVAADLLKKGNGNISEIAYTVGFNDVSYFSKCFKEVFSTTPSEYLNSKQTP